MIQPGALAPDITLLDGVGGEHPLRGLVEQPTLLIFFKTDCPVTPEVLPVYAGWRRYEPAVQLVGVSQDDPDQTATFLEELGVKLPTFYDSEPYRASSAFGLRAVPAAALLVEGKVTWSGEGWNRQGAEQLAQQLASLAGDEPVVVGADRLPPFKPG
jgi:peroxiredoxin